MSDKPKPGEWWRDLRNDQIVSVLMVTDVDDVCVRDKEGHLGIWQVAQFRLNYEHLPECDSFDWEKDRTVDLLAAIVNLRDNMDRLNKRVAKLEQASVMTQVIGSASR